MMRHSMLVVGGPCKVCGLVFETLACNICGEHLCALCWHWFQRRVDAA